MNPLLIYRRLNKPKNNLINLKLKPLLNFTIDRYAKKLLKKLWNSTLNLLTLMAKDIVEKTVNHAYRLAKAAQMKGTISILQLALANLIYGDSVNYLDPENKLNNILMSDLTEQQKQFYLEKRFDQLEKQGRIRHQLQPTGVYYV